jgi:hypothetical protein
MECIAHINILLTIDFQSLNLMLNLFVDTQIFAFYSDVYESLPLGFKACGAFV